MGLTRRQLLKTGTAGIASLALARQGLSSPPPPRSKLAIVKNASAVDDRDFVHRGECRRMVQAALELLTGKNQEAEAWTALGLLPDDVVAIKLNCNRHYFPLTSHSELTYAVCESLQSVIPANQVVIYERYTRELADAGYVENTSSAGVRCMATEQAGGFERESKISRLLTDHATKIVHIPTLKYIGGTFQASLFLKGHIGSIRPQDMPSCHDDPLVCTELLAHPHIRAKNLLNICDALRGTFDTRKPWFYRGIVAAVDPVAAEVGSLSILQEKRELEGLSTVSIGRHVTEADRAYHLGTADLQDINILRRELEPQKSLTRNDSFLDS